MAGYMDVGAAIKAAEAALKEKRRVLKIIDTVRSDLRNAVDRQEATEDQRRWIGEHFPLRERKRKSKPQPKPLPTTS